MQSLNLIHKTRYFYRDTKRYKRVRGRERARGRESKGEREQERDRQTDLTSGDAKDLCFEAMKEIIPERGMKGIL